MKIDATEFIRSARAQIQAIAQQAGEEVIKAAYETSNEAKRRTPVDTGALRSGWQVIDVKRTPYGAEATVINKTKYARTVEYGSQAHTIRAKNAKVLANRKTGQFFGRSVDHPGTKKQPMLGPAISKILPELKRRLKGL